jgi:hypothetical protein
MNGLDFENFENEDLNIIHDDLMAIIGKPYEIAGGEMNPPEGLRAILECLLRIEILLKQKVASDRLNRGR